jgi:hypothetical protein
VIKSDCLSGYSALELTMQRRCSLIVEMHAWLTRGLTVSDIEC